MTEDRAVNLTKSIDKSLRESAAALEAMKGREDDMPRPARALENRLLTIQQELDSLSGNMLAYKLRRIADSKMLVQAAHMHGQSFEADRAGVAKSSPVGERKRPAPMAPEYQSTTFQCKSDLDLCLRGAKGALDKALCYALFIRCAFKG